MENLSSWISGRGELPLWVLRILLALPVLLSLVIALLLYCLRHISLRPSINSQNTGSKTAFEVLQAELNSIFVAAPIGIGVVINRVLMQVNRRMCEMSGYTSDELIGKSARVLYPAQEDFDFVGREKYRQIAEKGTGTVETRWLKKDGTIIDVLLSSTPLDTNDLSRGVTFTAMDITERKRSEQALEKRLIALTQPLEGSSEIAFEDLFNLEDIQRIQDMFAQAAGVASIITTPDGTPITHSSRFCRLCSECIRTTELGLRNCFRSDAVIGRYHPEGPIVQTCLSGGLWDAGASISVGGRHIANWLIGQVRDETQTEEKMREYARAIGAEEKDFIKAFYEVPGMSRQRFEQIAEALFIFANQLSSIAYQNIQQARFITERKKAEQALKESEQRYAMAQRAAHIGSWDWNILTGGMIWSETIEPMYGFAPGGFKRTFEACMECVCPEDRSQVTDSLKACIEQGIEFVNEHRIVWPDGSVHWVAKTGNVLRDQSGRAVRMLGIVQDISQQKKDQEDLQRSLRELQHKNEELETIVFVTSHDMRSPLVNIEGFTGELKKSFSELEQWVLSMKADEPMAGRLRRLLQEDIPESLRYISMGTSKMDVLLSGLLQLSRIGTTPLKIRRIDMNLLLQDVLETFRFQIREAGIDVQFQEVPACCGDQMQITQVFSNLLDNAIKYRHPNRAAVIRIHGQRQGGKVVYAVEDNGIGIDPAHHAKIFEIFHQLNPTGSRQGVGLGLTIIRRILNRHEGDIRVESSPNQGAAFYVSLPATD